MDISKGVVSDALLKALSTQKRDDISKELMPTHDSPTWSTRRHLVRTSQIGYYQCLNNASTVMYCRRRRVRRRT